MDDGQDGVVGAAEGSCWSETEYWSGLELLLLVTCVTLTVVRLLGSTIGTARVRGDWRSGEEP